MNKDHKPLSGFTLIELLIVVAIIGILAAIAVPNLMLAHVKCKVARATNDMRVIGMALELYRVDNTAYPPSYLSQIPMLASLNKTELNRLSTPMEYITRVPEDVFKVEDPFYQDYAPIDYYNPKDFSLIPVDGRVPEWILISLGPNQMLDYRSSSQILYDPTNGTISEGDILFTDKGLTESFPEQ